MATFKILIIDDKTEIREGTKRILQNFRVNYSFIDEQIDFQIFEAETGKAGIEIIDSEQPDILVLDNELPDIQDVDVLEYVKRKHNDIFVVLITSYASLEKAVKATRDGAFDFIPKPFTPKEIRASVENITRQIFLKRMTQSLNKTGKQIRFQFLSVLSHELKSPLNAVDGYIKMIKDRQFGNNIDAYDEMLDRSVERIKGMRQLILDLLDLTKIETGKPTQRLEMINVSSIVQLSIDTIRPYAIQKDVEIYINSRENVEMRADAGEIEIIMNNLISNAVKYNKPGGRVDVFLEKTGNVLNINVSDAGIGLKSDDRDKIFEEFVRIKSFQTREITGSGLGLSIVKKIVDMYNGNIEVQSEPDKGTSFMIKLIEPAEKMVIS